MSAMPSRLAAAGLAPGRSQVALLALLTLMTLEAVRSSGPLLDVAFSSGGAVVVAGLALATYAAPSLVALGILVAVRRRATSTSSVMPVGSVLLGGLRLVDQGLGGDARVAVGLATVAAAIGVLTVGVALQDGRPGGGRVVAGALCAGAAAGVGLELTLGTWDALWRHSLLGWLVALVMVVCLVWLAVLVRRDPVLAPTDRVHRLWVAGPWLALSAFMLANPAFASSQSGLPLAVAGPLHAAGLALASWLSLRSGTSVSRGGRSAGPLSAHAGEAVLFAVLVAAGVCLGGVVPFDGLLVLVALLGAQLAAARALGRALEPKVATPGGVSLGGFTLMPLRWVGSTCLVGVGTIVPLLLYQIDYDIPLGFPNELVIVATAMALAVAGLRRPTVGVAAATSTGDRHAHRSVVAASCALVLLGTCVAVVAWIENGRAPRLVTADRRGPSEGRVVSWNLHYGVSPGGSVDLETTARTIAAQHPDAVLLQEISRGWVLGGGADMATWLSNRLGRQFAFAPAADRRFGNVILSVGTPADVEVTRLPYGAGPQDRSAIAARVRVGNGVVRVVSVHLQQRQSNTPTRIRELATLLGAIRAADRSGQSPMILGGDFNAGPGSPESALMTDAGFASAIDSVGNPAALTAPTNRPTRRIDWVFGRRMTFRSATVLVGAHTSDHLPVVVATDP